MHALVGSHHILQISKIRVKKPNSSDWQTLKMLPSLVPKQQQTLFQQIIPRYAVSYINFAIQRLMKKTWNDCKFLVWKQSVFNKWNNFTFIYFYVTTQFYKFFPSWSHINTLYTAVDCKIFSVSRVDHGVQKFGRLWTAGRITWVRLMARERDLSPSQNWLLGLPSLLSNTLTPCSQHAA